LVYNSKDEIYRLFRVDKKRFGASYEAFLNAIHPEDRDKVNDAYTSSLANRKPYSIVHRLCLDDGTVRWVNERCRTEYDECGRPTRSIGTVQDITELHQAQEDLQKAKERAENADSLKSTFLANMSHEIRHVKRCNNNEISS
jgi:signal transduction histidine kinase